MRTTLDIADDVLAAAGTIASERGRTRRRGHCDRAREGSRLEPARLPVGASEVLA